MHLKEFKDLKPGTLLRQIQYLNDGESPEVIFVGLVRLDEMVKHIHLSSSDKWMNTAPPSCFDKILDYKDLSSLQQRQYINLLTNL